MHYVRFRNGRLDGERKNMHNFRKKAVLSSTVVAGVLVMASAAFACTSWIGQFQVTGNAGTSGTVTADGKGTTTSFTMTQCVDSPIAKSTNGSPTRGSVTIWTGQVNSGCSNITGADGRLPECGSGGSPATCTGSNKRQYDIRFFNSSYGLLGKQGYSTHTQWSQDCMNGGILGATRLGGVEVDSSGNLSRVVDGGTYDSTTKKATFNLPTGVLNTDSGGKESAACISDTNAYYGNQAPLTIIGG